MSDLLIHLSADFPDHFAANKTPAIRNLLAGTSDRFDHVIYSLNRLTPAALQGVRTSLGLEVPVVQCARSVNDIGDVSSLRYVAPGKSILLITFLRRLADWIGNDMEHRGITPKLVIGHKLTIEGVLAEELAKRFGVPFGISIQGNTDLKIATLRPDLASIYRSIFHRAAVIFPFAPWALQALEERFGGRQKPTVVLPVATAADRILPPRLVGPHLVSAFHLQHYRSKNAAALVRAAEELQNEIDDFSIEIIGDGPLEARLNIERLASRRGVSSVGLPGPIRHKDIQERFNRAAGFAMVSHRESFGMVFVEALLAGCPVVYPAGRAIDGFFEGCSFAIGAHPSRQEEITEAMRKLVVDEQSLKTSLAAWLESPAAVRFQREAIFEAFSEGVREALGASR